MELRISVDELKNNDFTKQNYYGFTQETASLLKGFNCKNETIQFLKKRDVSTNELVYLGKEELSKIGEDNLYEELSIGDSTISDYDKYLILSRLNAALMRIQRINFEIITGSLILNYAKCSEWKHFYINSQNTCTTKIMISSLTDMIKSINHLTTSLSTLRKKIQSSPKM